MILATIGMTSYQAAGRSGRDAKRKSDLEQVRSALEIFKSENTVYPDDAGSCGQPAALTSGYINPYPSDPRSPAQYCYNRLTTTTYVLCASLENGNAAQIAACGALNCGSGKFCNYAVANP